MKLNWYISGSKLFWKGGAKGGLMCPHTWRLHDNKRRFWRFSSMRLFLMAHLPPLLPSLFKKVLIMKYINSISFCTKNEVHKASRSIFTLILIWGDSQAKSMIFFDYEILFYASFSHFLAKIEFLEFTTLYISI